MNNIYLIIVLFGVCVAVSSWLRVRHDRSAGKTSSFEAVFPRFMIFVGSGLCILIGIIWLIDANKFVELLGTRYLSILILIVALLAYLITRRFDLPNSKFLARQSSFILIVFTLPISFYWALMEGINPLLILPLIFISTMISIVLISRKF